MLIIAACALALINRILLQRENGYSAVARGGFMRTDDVDATGRLYPSFFENHIVPDTMNAQTDILCLEIFYLLLVHPILLKLGLCVM